MLVFFLLYLAANVVCFYALFLRAEFNLLAAMIFFDLNG